jgi:transcriptional regulator with XRE-family HTH domain
MSDILSANLTSASGVTPSAEVTVNSRTPTMEEAARDLTERAGFARNVHSVLGEDLTEVHHRSLRLQLDTRIEKFLGRDPTELLGELAELGFGWRDIARMVGVSVPALRRWRQGEMPTGENRRAIAQLLAFVQILSEDHAVFGPASWMEAPIVSDAPTTRVDLYAAGRLEVVFDLAANKCTPEAAMDSAEPGWRDRYRSDWEVADAEDGQPVIRRKPGR